MTVTEIMQGQAGEYFIGWLMKEGKAKQGYLRVDDILIDTGCGLMTLWGQLPETFQIALAIEFMDSVGICIEVYLSTRNRNLFKVEVSAPGTDIGRTESPQAFRTRNEANKAGLDRAARLIGYVKGQMITYTRPKFKF